MAGRGGGGVVSAWLPHDATWAADINSAGDIKLAYYDAARQIHLWDGGTGKETTPFHQGKSDRASSGAAVLAVGRDALLAFRDKEPLRDWYVAPFADPAKLSGLGEETVPLTRIQLQKRNDGVASLWYGEQQEATGKHFQIYYRDLNENGAPIGEPQKLFEGIYPVMAVRKDGQVAALSWIKEGAKHKIVARSRASDAKTFGPVVIVADTGPITPFFTSVANGNRVIALWHAQYGEDLQAFRLEGAYSDDGAQWSPIHIKSLDGLDVESGELVSDGSGNLALVATVITPEDRNMGGKMRTVIVTSHDNGQTWGEAQNLRKGEFLAKNPYSHARSAKAAFLSPNVLFVAWQDWRTLRSAVRYSYSEDAGKTWKVHDEAITQDLAVNERLALHTKSIFVAEKSVKLVIEKLNADLLTEKQLIIREIAFGDLKAAPKVTEPQAPDTDRLKERVLSYWNALQARDFERTYAMQDPYFRARVPYATYKQELGRIDYEKPEIKFSETIGPIAAVVSNVTVGFKPITINGRTMKMDPTEREIPTRWLWIDGEWYLEFYQQSRSLRYVPF